MASENTDVASMKAEIERLKSENEDLKKKKPVSLKVSEKGAVSLYGIRRFPVTFYKDEWETILGMAEEIHAFMGENASKLKTK